MMIDVWWRCAVGKETDDVALTWEHLSYQIREDYYYYYYLAQEDRWRLKTTMVVVIKEETQSKQQRKKQLAVTCWQTEARCCWRMNLFEFEYWRSSGCRKNGINNLLSVEVYWHGSTLSRISTTKDIFISAPWFKRSGVLHWISSFWLKEWW